MAKPSRGFLLRYRLLIALALERGVGVELPRDFLLPYRLLIALTFEREAPLRNRLDTTKFTTFHLNGWIVWTASSCHFSRISLVLDIDIPEAPPRTSTLKLIYPRNRYKEYALSTTIREAVSDTTVRSNF